MTQPTDQPMACPHAIANSRVIAWWEREETRKPARAVSPCPCCMGPCPVGSVLCRFCNVEVRGQIELPEPWYGR